MIWSCQQGWGRFSQLIIMAVKFVFKSLAHLALRTGIVELSSLKFYWIQVPLKVKSY